MTKKKEKLYIIDPKVILKGWTEKDKREYLKQCGYTDAQIAEMEK